MKSTKALWSECMNWASHITGDGYSCQGNILASREVVESMAKAYETTKGDLIERLLNALTAGQRAGRSQRTTIRRPSSRLRERWLEGFTDRYVDLRVDDSPRPTEELKRVFKIYDMTMLAREDPTELIAIEGSVAKSLQRSLRALGFYKKPITGIHDEATREALLKFVNINNFENKMRRDGYIWRSILRHMQASTRRKQMRH